MSVRVVGPMVVCSVLAAVAAAQEHPFAAPGVTSLTNPDVKYIKADRHWVALERGGVRIVVADNSAIDLPELPGHREGYNGLASLVRPGNLGTCSYPRSLVSISSISMMARWPDCRRSSSRGSPRWNSA